MFATSYIFCFGFCVCNIIQTINPETTLLSSLTRFKNDARAARRSEKTVKQESSTVEQSFAKLANTLSIKMENDKTSNTNIVISRMEQARIDAMEQEAKDYEEQKKKEEFQMQSRRKKMQTLMEEEISSIIGTSEWNKSKIARWMQEIIDSTGEVLDQFLSNLGVFKYAIDVIILKSTAVAKQSENLISF